jgi:restriction system protein
MALWLVRAGKNGEREDFAIDNKVAVIGWSELPDLSGVKTRNELKTLLISKFPVAPAGRLKSWESQIWQFVKDIHPGDQIVLPLKHRAVIAIGEVSGDYIYEKDHPSSANHVRPVKSWHEYGRYTFDPDLLYSFGMLRTIGQIQRNDAENRITAILSGKKSEVIKINPEMLAESTPDLEELARFQIVEYINRKFKGHRLTDLVEAILNAQGYQTRKSPEGPDGGVDILAGQGLLGYEPPRLAVQVKSTEGPVGANVFNELQGAITNFGADQGLLVSWGGYKVTVEKEAARHFFKMRIWDADMVVKLIEEYYEKLPEEIQADLPLRRIWTLIREDDEE